MGQGEVFLPVAIIIAKTSHYLRQKAWFNVITVSQPCFLLICFKNLSADQNLSRGILCFFSLRSVLANIFGIKEN